MSSLPTRDKILAALEQLIGLRLSAVRRAANMRTMQFGILRSVPHGSVGDFALHIQCPWRIEGPVGIVTDSADLWRAEGEKPDFDLELWHYETSPNLQDVRIDRWFAEHPSSLIVESVDADEFGGAVISFGEGFVLRLFPADSGKEDWRLFRPQTDLPHFVIVRGEVEDESD